MEGKLQCALERVLCKPKEMVEVEMEPRMKELGLDKFVPSEAWPPMFAVRVAWIICVIRPKHSVWIRYAN